MMVTSLPIASRSDPRAKSIYTSLSSAVKHCSKNIGRLIVGVRQAKLCHCDFLGFFDEKAVITARDNQQLAGTDGYGRGWYILSGDISDYAAQE